MKPILSAVAIAMMLAACQREPQPPAPRPSPAAAPARSATPEGPAPKPAAAIPRLDVETLDGKAWSLQAQRGQWVLVNYWATWCGPCLKEMPELSALHTMREHVSVIGLAYEDTSAADLKAFLAKRPVTYPVALVDIHAPPADLEPPRGLPLTYLIAPDGRIARTFAGPVTARGIEEAIAQAGGPPAAGS